jgi:hypothetical protein
MTTDLVIDAVSRLAAIVATQDRDAVPCSPTRCVVANRLRRLPGVIDVRVGARSARIQRADGWHRYDLHPDTIAAIHAYDAACEVMPAGFRVVLLPPRKPLGARTGETPGTNRRSGARASVATRTPSTRSLFVEPPAA